MIKEPDPTTPDPVAYVKAWVEWAMDQLMEKQAQKAPQDPQTIKPQPSTLA